MRRRYDAQRANYTDVANMINATISLKTIWPRSACMRGIRPSG